MDSRILVWGYGKMTGAMVEGWLASGIPASAITAYNPRPKDTPEGVRMTTRKPDEAFDVVVLGFKPHMLHDIRLEMAPVIDSRTTVLSVLAGVELRTLRQAFPQAGMVVRFMPNLACALGKSPNALLADGGSDDDRTRITDLAHRLGTAEWLENEDQFDLVTALAGSGPGFVYRFIDALSAAATDLGLEQAQAERLAVQMVEGAGALAARSAHSPRELAARVASPGGMTQKGLDVLDKDDALVDLLRETLRAARDRGAEMAAEARGKG